MKNFSFSRQHDTMQCGITCLQMVCRHYGKEFSIETLSRYCFATTEGVSLLGISEAANKLGLHSICGRVSMEQIQQAPLPCILHWNQNHFVVLYQIKKGKKFCIADPGKGLVTYNRKEFAEYWVSTRSQGEEKGIAMFIQPTPLFYEQESDTHTDKRSFKFLFGYMKQYRRYFGQILLGALVGCLLQLVFPFLTQAIVDVGIEQRNLNIIYLILLGEDGGSGGAPAEHGKERRPTGGSRERQDSGNGYSRRADTTLRGILALGEEPIGIGRIKLWEKKKK